MGELQYARRDEQVDAAALRSGAIDPSLLLGRWVNTSPETAGITSVVIARQGDGVALAVQPASGSPYQARVHALYANAPTAMTATALTATALTGSHRSGSVETELEMNLSLGLLVIAASHTSPSDDPRGNYFEREFFYYAGEPASR